jgi:cytochrome b6-f complex iron-sulfur subunit
LDTDTASQSTRREFLNYAWLASLGVMALQLTGITIYLSLPRFKAGEFGGIIVVGPVSDLPDEGSDPVNNPEGKFFFVRTEAGLLALYKVCTHLDCLVLWDEQEQRFICPCHGSQFARNGHYVSGPAPRSLDRFVIQAVSEEGSVLAEADPNQGGLLPVPADEGDSATSGTSAGQAGDTSEVTITVDSIVQVDTGRKLPGQLAEL